MTSACVLDHRDLRFRTSSLALFQRPATMPHSHALPEHLRRMSSPAAAAPAASAGGAPTTRARVDRLGRRPLLTLEVQHRSSDGQLETARPHHASSATSIPTARPFPTTAADSSFCSISRSSSASSSSSTSSSSSAGSSRHALDETEASSAFADFAPAAIESASGRALTLPRVRTLSFDADDDVASSWSDDMEGFPAVAASAAAGAKPSPTVGASPLSAALLASPSQATERPISRAFAYRSQAIRQLAAPPSPVPSEEERRGRRGRS